MEKVKITQEQENAIKDVLEAHGKDSFINLHALEGNPWKYEWESLNDLKVSDLARVLYIGYEVEPEFKVGDWVKSTMGYPVGKVTKIGGLGAHTDFGQIGSIRHATPQEIATEKERRWWNKHNRYVWEIRVGDVLRYKSGLRAIRTVTKINSIDEYVTDENYTPFTKEELINSFEVVCFAEDRKDI